MARQNEVAAPEDGAVVITSSAEIEAAPFDASAFATFVERRSKLIEMALPIALASTNERDWRNIGKKPHLEADGVEKVRARFGISASNVRQDKVTGKDERGQYYIWITYMDFRFPGSSEVLTATGAVSSRAQFWAKRGDEWKRLYEIPEASILKHSWTNCMHNGVTSLLGIKNISWEDLNNAKAITFDPDKVESVDFKGDADAGGQKPAAAKTPTKAKAKGTTKAKAKSERKGTDPATADERRETIGEFNGLMDYLLDMGVDDEEALLEKYLKFSKATDDGATHPSMERVQQFKTVKAIGWLRGAIEAIKRDEDMEGFDAWMAAQEDPGQ
jgi:hypothetical protein